MATQEERIVALERGMMVMQRDFLDQLREINRSMVTLNKSVRAQELNVRDVDHEATILLGLVTAHGKDIRAVKSDLDAFREDMDMRFEVVDQRFDTIDRRFEAVNQRVDTFEQNVNSRFEAVDRRFDAVDQRFEGQDKKLDRVLQILTGLASSLGHQEP